MDVKEFFEHPEDYSGNPLNFILHRIGNSPVFSDVELSLLKLNEQDITGCTRKLLKAQVGLKEIAGFLKSFRDELSEKGWSWGDSGVNTELLEALKKLHKNCLYQLHKDDDRPTHVPYGMFTEIENVIANAEKAMGDKEPAKSEYEYEMFFQSDSKDIVKMDGWIAISTDSIRYPERIKKYIQSGLLRKIEK
jgi:hypothetical protein